VVYQREVDLVLTGGKIATLDGEDRIVQALAAKDGKIVALGQDHEIADLAGPATSRLDAGGRLVIPGIIDSHCHPDAAAARAGRWTQLTPDRVPDRAALLTLIERTARGLPQDCWFAGNRFDENRSGGYPTIEELDAAGNGRPVFILRTDSHLGLANAAAFAARGIDAGTPDPPFGAYDRNPATGKFTGLTRESAAKAFVNHIDAGVTDRDVAAGFAAVFEEFLSYGITSWYNSLTPARAIRAYQILAREQALPLRAGIIASGFEEGLIEAFAAAGIQSGFGDDWLRLIGVEWCPDCSTSGRTAAYYEPYVGTPAEG